MTVTATKNDEVQTEVQTGNACIVCWQSPTDRAHLIDRSLASDPYGDPARVVFLCRKHHDEYDAHTLNLLPYLEPRHRHELARAVELVGVVTTLERVSGMSWTPASEEAAIRRDIERVSNVI
jgi:hypothetical protein